MIADFEAHAGTRNFLSVENPPLDRQFGTRVMCPVRSCAGARSGRTMRRSAIPRCRGAGEDVHRLGGTATNFNHADCTPSPSTATPPSSLRTSRSRRCVQRQFRGSGRARRRAHQGWKVFLGCQSLSELLTGGGHVDRSDCEQSVQVFDKSSALVVPSAAATLGGESCTRSRELARVPTQSELNDCRGPLFRRSSSRRKQ